MFEAASNGSTSRALFELPGLGEEGISCGEREVADGEAMAARSSLLLLVLWLLVLPEKEGGLRVIDLLDCTENEFAFVLPSSFGANNFCPGSSLTNRRGIRSLRESHGEP